MKDRVRRALLGLTFTRVEPGPRRGVTAGATGAYTDECKGHIIYVVMPSVGQGRLGLRILPRTWSLNLSLGQEATPRFLHEGTRFTPTLSQEGRSEAYATRIAPPASFFGTEGGPTPALFPHVVGG
jgi:hypothetical protein